MDKNAKRERRKKSIKKKIIGSEVRPRLCINKTLKNLSVQIVNDFDSKTICGLSTDSKAIADKITSTTRKNVVSAKTLGKEIAELAISKGIKKVVFDRAGYKYHGVVKALADSARENGLEF